MLTQTAGVLLTNSGTNGSASLLSMLLPFVILIAVFYFPAHPAGEQEEKGGGQDAL